MGSGVIAGEKTEAVRSKADPARVRGTAKIYPKGGLAMWKKAGIYVKLSLLGKAILLCAMAGCMVVPVGGQNQRSQPPQPAKTDVCISLYEIYQTCYEEGRGKRARECTELGQYVTQNLNLGDKDLETFVGSFCSEACKGAAGRQGQLAYSEFVPRCHGVLGKR
jgi:hypothetical protein